MIWLNAELGTGSSKLADLRARERQGQPAAGQGGITLTFRFLTWGNWGRVMPFAPGAQEEEDTGMGWEADIMSLDSHVLNLRAA